MFIINNGIDMGIRRTVYNIPLLAILAALPAQAAEPYNAFNFKGIYTFGLTGLDIGRMGIEIEQDPNHYAAVADITLVGLAKMIANHSSHTTIEASGSHFTYPNRQYESQYRTKKKKKSVLLEYKNGKIVSEDIQPPDNRDTRPAVSAQMKNTGYDPLSFILEMRTEAATAAKDGTSSFVIHAFDGRRLTEATFTVLGKKNITFNGRRISTTALSVKRKPLEGFTASEIEDWSPKEPPLFVYFSDDERFIPLRLELTMWFGTLTADLAKECRTGESCLLGIKD